MAPLAARADVIARTAACLAAGAPGLARAVGEASGRDENDVWSAEVIPTLDALRWLARDGARGLRPRRLGRARLQWYFRATRHELAWEPHGVVAVVTPANAPLFLAVPQVAAALMAGNTVRWKPAPAGVAIARRIGLILGQAGLPPGALDVVEGGADAARALVRAGVDLLHFTGSAHAGHELARLHAEHGRPAVLELSGRHVAVVLDDADARLAARGIAWAKRANDGRNCLSVQLVLAGRTVAPATTEALAGALSSAARGDAHPRGPDEIARLHALVEDAEAAGATLVWRGADGAALLAGVRRGMRVVDEEVAGPVLGIAMVRGEDDALAWINESPFRLSASIWSGDVRGARALAGRLDVGHVWINDELQAAAHPEATLAGRGASGFGASRGLAGLMAMVTPKVVSITPHRASRRHYAAAGPATVALLHATATLAFARGRARVAAVRRIVPTVLRLLGGAR
jgi:acyl-CoA reductase-like NAD-dependent aldehyde dehydrogenase